MEVKPGDYVPSLRWRQGEYQALAALSEAANANPEENHEIQNVRAVQVLRRVKEKLTGRDFKPGRELDVEEQVGKLIGQATSVENLCQHYIGWCSFW